MFLKQKIAAREKTGEREKKKKKKKGGRVDRKNLFKSGKKVGKETKS